MTGEPDNLTLIDLRRLDAKMDRVIEDLADVKVRLTAVEEAVVRLTHRVDRIERRLDLVDMPH